MKESILCLGFVSLVGLAAGVRLQHFFGPLTPIGNLIGSYYNIAAGNVKEHYYVF